MNHTSELGKDEIEITAILKRLRDITGKEYDIRVEWINSFQEVNRTEPRIPRVSLDG